MPLALGVASDSNCCEAAISSMSGSAMTHQQRFRVVQHKAKECGNASRPLLTIAAHLACSRVGGHRRILERFGNWLRRGCAHYQMYVLRHAQDSMRGSTFIVCPKSRNFVESRTVGGWGNTDRVHGIISWRPDLAPPSPDHVFSLVSHLDFVTTTMRAIGDGVSLGRIRELLWRHHLYGVPLTNTLFKRQLSLIVQLSPCSPHLHCPQASLPASSASFLSLTCPQSSRTSKHSPLPIRIISEPNGACSPEYPLISKRPSPPTFLNSIKCERTLE
jgi:hypothetical protein